MITASEARAIALNKQVVSSFLGDKITEAAKNNRRTITIEANQDTINSYFEQLRYLGYELYQSKNSLRIYW